MSITVNEVVSAVPADTQFWFIICNKTAKCKILNVECKDGLTRYQIAVC